MKRPRPWIPHGVRCQVALRQLGIDPPEGIKTATARLRLLLLKLAVKMQCSPADLELDHEPALINRPFNEKTGKYSPDANDPDWLAYRTKQDHDIKTRVRGDGALLSDLALRRKLKRIAANRRDQKKKKIPHRVNPWPTGRTFMSAARKTKQRESPK